MNARTAGKPAAIPPAEAPGAAKSPAKAGTAVGPEEKTAAKSRGTVKSVKGSYKLPADDYALFDVLKKRAAATGTTPRKNDLIRAGLHALMESGRAELRRTLDRLPPATKR